MAFSEPILHVDMDAFFVEVERLRDPSLRGRPVVVGGTGPRAVVAAASYEVRPFGVRSAMPMSAARRACPGLIVVPPDRSAYSEASERLFELFREFTPLVEGLSVDEAFLDVRGLRHHFGDPGEIGTAIRQRIRDELSLPASVGVAASKFVAKLASERAKPDGLLWVRVGDQQAFLDELDVSELWGVGVATKAALERLGVETVADLGSVPPGLLERAVGESHAAHLRDLAAGHDPRPVEPDQRARSISVEHTFDRDLSSTDEIRSALAGHADEVTRRLRRAGLRARTVTLKVRDSEFHTVTRSETLAGSVDVSTAVFKTVMRLLERVELGAGRKIRLLGIGLSGLEARDRPEQMVAGTDRRWESVDRALDEVRDRFGGSAVGRAGARPDAG
jgi:DNA polymerase-4